MAKRQICEQALSLPVEERVELADDLWASIQRDGAKLPLWPWQAEILEERLKMLDEEPEGGSTWEGVKGDLWQETSS